MEEPVALGPKSELGKLSLDWRSPLTGFAAGILQLMYPALGTGVTQHSDFFNESYERIQRSVPRIVAQSWPTTVRAGRPTSATTTATSRGVDDQGRPYHALEQETFWWAHATFT